MQNQWGPYFPQSTYAYPSDGGVPSAPANPAQSPSGALSADAPPPQFDTGEMITQQFLSGVGENIPPQGTPVATVQPHLAGVPDSQVAWNNWTGGTVGNKFS
jgi:hypothetical protein